MQVGPENLLMTASAFAEYGADAAAIHTRLEANKILLIVFPPCYVSLGPAVLTLY